jgi:hypothetical protein
MLGSLTSTIQTQTPPMAWLGRFTMHVTRYKAARGLSLSKIRAVGHSVG